MRQGEGQGFTSVLGEEARARGRERLGGEGFALLLRVIGKKENLPFQPMPYLSTYALVLQGVTQAKRQACLRTTA